MRRRITLAMVLMTVATLVVTGLVTLALTVHTTRNQTRRELARETLDLAVSLQGVTLDRTGSHLRTVETTLRTLKSPLRLEGSAILALQPAGSFFDPTAPATAVKLPSGLALSDLDATALLAGTTISGQRGNVAYAASPVEVTYLVGTTPHQLDIVVVLTRQAPTGLLTALPWLILSSIAVLIAAVVVADRLGRRIVRPLRAAQGVTAQIAGGDLSARVPDAPGTDAELAALGSSINSMAEQLTRARSAQRAFLLTVSHELRTPLTSIQGFAEAVQDGTADDVQRAAGIIADGARRLDRLVQDLLDLARLEGGRFSLHPRSVLLEPIVRQAVASFEPTARELTLDLELQISPSPTVVLADPDRLSQVVVNLVENALKYATRRIRIGCGTLSDVPTIWIEDDGPGISAEDLPHVFTALYTSRTRPGRQVGTGLGLAIVAELVASMGGTVRSGSPSNGPGTRMTVSLSPRQDATPATNVWPPIHAE